MDRLCRSRGGGKAPSGKTSSPVPIRNQAKGRRLHRSAVITLGEAMGPAEELLLGTVRPDLEPVVTELVLPVLAIKLPLKVFVVNDNRLFSMAGRDARPGRLCSQAISFGLQDLELDLGAVARQRPELAGQAGDAVAGDPAGIPGCDRLLQGELLEYFGGDLRGLPRLVGLLQHLELVAQLVDPRERLEQRLVV